MEGLSKIKQTQRDGKTPKKKKIKDKVERYNICIVRIPERAEEKGGRSNL